MEVLNILNNNTLFLSILVGILLINFGCIIYLIIREKKEDKKEIYDILNQPEVKNELLEEKQDQKLEENKREVEEMLIKIQKDLEATPEDVVTNFENEQEEKSIISYQELLKSVREKKEIDSKVTPVKIEDNKIEIDEFDNEDTIIIEPIIDSNKKFKNTEFISPIFGRQDNKMKYPTVPKLNREDDKIALFDSLDIDYHEKIVDTKKLDEEIRKNDEFLKALKDFRKKLD